MYLCKLKLGVSENGKFHVNFTSCNKTDTQNRQRNVTSASQTSEDSEDAFGAMQYTIAVVVLYGVAMLGVFGIGQFRRRKRRNENMDHETNVFLKNYDEVRRIWEQQSRVGAISSLLHQLHNQPVTGEGGSKTRPSVNSLAFLPITLSEIQHGIWNSDRSTLDWSFDGSDRDSSTDQGAAETDNQRKESRVTLLGSSRRKFSTCRQCSELQGLNISKHECLCMSSTNILIDNEFSGPVVEDRRIKHAEVYL